MFTTKSDSIASHFLDRSLNLFLFLEHQPGSQQLQGSFSTSVILFDAAVLNQPEACQILVGNVLYILAFTFEYSYFKAMNIIANLSFWIVQPPKERKQSSPSCHLKR